MESLRNRFNPVAEIAGSREIGELPHDAWGLARLV